MSTLDRVSTEQQRIDQAVTDISASLTRFGTQLAASLATVGATRLGALNAGQVAKVVRRVVDHEAIAPKLEVARFNSSV